MGHLDMSCRRRAVKNNVSRGLCFILLSLLSASLFRVVEPSSVPGSRNALSLAENLEKLDVQFDRKSGEYVPTTRYYNFDIQFVDYTVNCSTSSALLVNGQFPGPPIHAVEGDRIVVNLTNSANTNITIHWHGVKQFLSGWQDGTAFITQCPLQAGEYFVYDFVVGNQRGTVFWHAHISWARYSVHGAFIVYPKTLTYPFGRPDGEFTVVIGEWWNNITLGIANVLTSDALTINGYTGPNYACGGKYAGGVNEGISTFSVERGKRYLLRVINAAVNTEMFFVVANHTLTVVEIDSDYVVPFESPYIALGPGQIANVLVTADQPGGSFYITAEGHGGDAITEQNLTAPQRAGAEAGTNPPPPALAILKYKGLEGGRINFPTDPTYNDSGLLLDFQNKLHGVLPSLLPKHVDRFLFITVGLGVIYSDTPCPPNATGPCFPFDIVASTNNISFVEPKIALLQAAVFNIPNVFTTNYPSRPPKAFNYTAAVSPPQPEEVTTQSTRVVVVEYGQTLDIVLQSQTFFEAENHPFHLHGQSFYVLGSAFGNYDPKTSWKLYNLVDPPTRFTVNAPAGGWVAIRFKAINPGMWLFHCHLDKHTVEGMELVFWVKDGKNADQKLPPPPARLTPC